MPRVEPARVGRHAHERGQRGRALTGVAVPCRWAIVRGRPERRVPRRKRATDRLRGGRSRRTPRVARPELSLLGIEPPMMAVTMTRSGRVRCGGRCTRCRVPRGGGSSEGRRGGGIGGGSRGRARERERGHGNQGRDERLSLHEGSGSSAPGRPGPRLLHSPTPSLGVRFRSPQLTMPLALALEPRPFPPGGNRPGSRPPTAPARARARSAAAPTDQHRPNSGPRRKD